MPLSLFYKITLGALAIISTLSTITIAIKKFEAFWKERKLANNINVMINNVQGQPQQNLNNKNYNDPILCTFLLILRAIVFIATLMFFIGVFNINSTTSDHIKNMWAGLAGKLIFKCVGPLSIPCLLLPQRFPEFHNQNFS